jgi:hypothetical protein
VPPDRPTSPPLNRWIPHPLAAATAARGWGIPDPRCVYSVGSAGCPAGGVVEAAARPERLLVAALVPSGGGASRSAAAERSSSSRSRILGSVRRGFPSPDPEWRRIRSSSLKKMVVRRCCAASALVQGLGVRRLPSCRGAASKPRYVVEQWQRRATGPFWPSARSGSRGPSCNFPLFLGLSVRIGVSF